MTQEPEDKLLTIEQVMERVALGKTAIYEKVLFNEFPKQIKLSGKAVRWSNNEISLWIRQQIEKRGVAPWKEPK